MTRRTAALIWERRRRPLTGAAAIAFAAATLLYNGLWMAAVRWQPDVELGFNSDVRPHEQIVTSVKENSPAKAAGLRPGDRIVAIDGAPLTDEGSQVRAWRQHRPGESVQLTIRRPGMAAPLVLTGVFRLRAEASAEVSIPEQVADEVRRWYPVPFVLVGLAVLALRFEESRVWLVALLLAGFAVEGGAHEQIVNMAPSTRPYVMAYRAILHSLLTPLFFWFCSVFPVRSAFDRRFPRVKLAGAAVCLMFAWFGIDRGESRVPASLARLLGERAAGLPILAVTYGLVVGGLLSIGWTYFHAADVDARRKIRVIFWGSIVGVAPAVAMAFARDAADFRPPWWLDTGVVALLFVFPLSLAYAVVRHRVLEIPVLLKRSARYVLVQRGFTVLLFLASAVAAAQFAIQLARRAAGAAAGPSSIAVGMVFGTVLFWRVSLVHRRVNARIDRAFFRESYDARRILESLAETTRAASTREELARLLEQQLREALQPDALTIYFRSRDGRLHASAGDAPALAPDLPWLTQLTQDGRPWECLPDRADAALVAASFRPFAPECLVAMAGRGGRLEGLLALGPRRSEEPYSREDQRLLASVASQAGVALENMRLAGEIVERTEVARLAAREMEIAREVQTRLLPQAAPRLATLECAARCIQARSVGGDYYDFLRLGERIGFVLGDVSGKGVHAALLMANLQAQMRSLGYLMPGDPTALLRQVNRVLFESTAPQHYATLFFGIYDDATRRLEYANCGHNPPLWIGRGGEVRRLPATGTVIGAFESWHGEVAEAQLAPGDLLAIYSDGVTEASRGEEEFGEERLTGELLAVRDRPAEDVVDRVLRAVQEFSAGTQSDDLTLLVAKAR